MRLADIMALNGITNADDIQAGQELQIPTGAVVYNTLPTPGHDTLHDVEATT